MNVEGTYWIPGLKQKDTGETTLIDVGAIMRGVLRYKDKADEKLVKGRLAAARNALSPTSEMVRVRSGVFRMGHTREDRKEDAFDLEFFSHVVTLTYDFWIGRYPVTCGEYDRFCDSVGKEKPEDRRVAGSKRSLHPVVFVNWRESIAYCNWLSEREGFKPAYDEEGHLLDTHGEKTSDLKKAQGYRLPTEAEWEYAARGGHKRSKEYRFSGTDDERELVTGDENNWPVGQTKPNDLGLFDMSSLVWEWCHDWYFYYFVSTFRTDPKGPAEGEKRVIRGGGFGEWFKTVVYNVAYREEAPPEQRNQETGFRVVRTCDEPS